MSLEATTGDPLDQEPEVDQSHPGRQLEDPQEVQQEGSNWCWAASIASAHLTLRGPDAATPLQHQIVARHIPCGGESVCDRVPPPEECNKTVQNTDLECLWRSEGFGKATFLPGKISLQELKLEICEGRPVQLELNNRHVILVFGWEVEADGTVIVHVLDSDRPSPPDTWPFEHLDDYNSGKWLRWDGTCIGLEFDGSTSC